MSVGMSKKLEVEENLNAANKLRDEYRGRLEFARCVEPNLSDLDGDEYRKALWEWHQNLKVWSNILDMFMAGLLGLEEFYDRAVRKGLLDMERQSRKSFLFLLAWGGITVINLLIFIGQLLTK